MAVGHALAELGAGDIELGNVDPSPVKPVEHRRGAPGPIDHHEIGQASHLVVSFPRGETRRSVVAEDEEEVGLRFLGPQGLQRVCGIAQSSSAYFKITDLETRSISRRRFHHGETVGGAGHLPAAHLLPGGVGHDQQHHVEVENLTSVERRHQVTDVRRIEGSAENPDPPTASAPNVHGGPPVPLRWSVTRVTDASGRR